MAISDLISYVVTSFKPVEQKKVEADVSDLAPAGYRPLFFHCWLCKGVTKFALKDSIKKKKFTTDCSRCGVENVVSVGL